MTEVFIVDTKQGLESAVNEMFNNLEKIEPILKSSKEDWERKLFKPILVMMNVQ